MDLRKKIPWYITWPLRLVIWPIALGAIVLGVLFCSSLLLARHVETCLVKTPPPRPDQGVPALATTQAIATCLDGKAGWFEKIALHVQKGSVQSPPRPLCYYVGRWKATRPGSVYEVTLNADHRFVAHPIKANPRNQFEDGGDVTGAWLSDGRKLTWMYDGAGPIWPPERNPIVEVGRDSFSIVERNGSRTRYELLEWIESPQCVMKAD